MLHAANLNAPPAPVHAPSRGRVVIGRIWIVPANGELELRCSTLPELTCGGCNPAGLPESSQGSKQRADPWKPAILTLRTPESGCQSRRTGGLWHPDSGVRTWFSTLSRGLRRLRPLATVCQPSGLGEASGPRPAVSAKGPCSLVVLARCARWIAPSTNPPPRAAAGSYTSPAPARSLSTAPQVRSMRAAASGPAFADQIARSS